MKNKMKNKTKSDKFIKITPAHLVWCLMEDKKNPQTIKKQENNKITDLTSQGDMK